MNLELFDSAADDNNAKTTDAATATATATAAEHPEVPAAILCLEAVYRDDLALRQTVAAAAATMNLRLSESGFNAFHPIDYSRVGIDRHCLATYARRVEKYAAHALGSAAAPFTGNLSEYEAGLRDLFGAFYDCVTPDEIEAVFKTIADAYSPVHLWREIYKAYDPAEQREVANQSAAFRIRGGFGMLRPGALPTMNIVKGRAEVLITVSTTPREAGATMSVASCARLRELGESLTLAMEAEGRAIEFGAALSNLADELLQHGGRRVMSRERVPLGDGVDVVMGYGTFKLYLPQDIADAVNMFLAEYPDLRCGSC